MTEEIKTIDLQELIDKFKEVFYSDDVVLTDDHIHSVLGYLEKLKSIDGKNYVPTNTYL